MDALDVFSRNRTQSSGETRSPTWRQGPLNLPPQDKGTAAWLVLLGASITEVVSCCMSKNYGVFRDYYFTHAPFTGIDILVVAGGVSEGCLALVISFLLSLIKRRPAWRKRMMILGMLPCVLGSSIGGAFSNQAWQIIVSQGAVYGSGAGTMSASAVSYVDGWFDKRQSFAYGVMYGMSRLIETFLPFVYVASLHSFGQRGTLLGHGCGALLLSTIALFCVRPRTPEPPKQQPVESTRDYSFAKRASFYLLGSSTILQALVLNLPAIYLPSFTTELGYSAAQGAITIAMFNLATWVGGFCFGLLADHRRSFYSSLFLGTVLSGLIVIFFWAEAKSLMAIVVFAFIYGWASGGFVSLRSRFANTIVGDSKDQAMTVFGTFTIARGVRLITIGGFIGQALVDESVERRLMDYRMRKWVHLMLFVGFGMLAAAGAGLVQWLSERGEKRRSDVKLGKTNEATECEVLVASTLVDPDDEVLTRSYLPEIRENQWSTEMIAALVSNVPLVAQLRSELN